MLDSLRLRQWNSKALWAFSVLAVLLLPNASADSIPLTLNVTINGSLITVLVEGNTYTYDSQTNSSYNQAYSITRSLNVQECSIPVDVINLTNELSELKASQNYYTYYLECYKDLTTVKNERDTLKSKPDKTEDFNVCNNNRQVLTQQKDACDSSLVTCNTNLQATVTKSNTYASDRWVWAIGLGGVGLFFGYWKWGRKTHPNEDRSGGR